MSIPVENIYYLLCYAWNKLDEKDRIPVSIDQQTNLLDLFAKIIITASKLLIKRGIDHDYISTSMEIAGIKGKLEYSQTLKRNLLSEQKASCTFDEFSSNILLNKILVSTLYRLIKTKGLDQQHKKDLKQLLWMLSGIESIELDANIFNSIKLNRNNRFYGFVLNICKIIYDSSLPTEIKGIYQFMDFSRDDEKMGRLFEAFIRNFYTIELKGNFSVKREIIKWQFLHSDAESFAYLPQMQTDITIENDESKIIIDAKFYKEMMAENFGKKTINSNNLQQLFSYLLNQESRDEKSTSAIGILLYPTIDREYNLSYKYLNHPIYIRTLNLNTNWRNIDRRLREIIGVIKPTLKYAGVGS